MTAALPTDIIIQHCHDKKWQYPRPIENLDEWVAANADAFDPQHAHRMYWPDRPYQAGMEILVVDGATTQAPVIARTNPEARVTATVHSKDSMDHAIYLKHKFGLGNLDLQMTPIDQIAELNRTFDLVIASGVLQNAGYAEAQLGMKSLAEVLRPEGVAAFLLYSRYVAGSLESGHRVGETPLHTGGLNFSAQDCLELVGGAGLVFQDWLFKSPYYLPADAARNSGVFEQITKLPEPQVWSVLETLRNQTGCHLFTACRPERPVESYRIDFGNPRALSYVPGWRARAGLDGRYAVRPGWSMSLDTTRREMVERLDGFKTIAQIAGSPELESEAVDLFSELWRMDFVMFGVDTVPMPTDAKA